MKIEFKVLIFFLILSLLAPVFTSVGKSINLLKYENCLSINGTVKTTIFKKNVYFENVILIKDKVCVKNNTIFSLGISTMHKLGELL